MAGTSVNKRKARVSVDKGTRQARPEQPAAPPSSGKPGRAKLFMHGRSQAVRLPKEFRFAGNEVRVTRVEDGVLLQPVEFDVQAWFKRLEKYRHIPFMPEGREQPEMPPDEPGDSFDE